MHTSSECIRLFSACAQRPFQKSSHSLPKVVSKKNCLHRVGKIIGGTYPDGCVKAGSVSAQYPRKSSSSGAMTGRSPKTPPCTWKKPVLPPNSSAIQFVLPCSFKSVV